MTTARSLPYYPARREISCLFPHRRRAGREDERNNTTCTTSTERISSGRHPDPFCRKEMRRKLPSVWFRGETEFEVATTNGTASNMGVAIAPKSKRSTKRFSILGTFGGHRLPGHAGHQRRRFGVVSVGDVIDKKTENYARTTRRQFGH